MSRFRKIWNFRKILKIWVKFGALRKGINSLKIKIKIKITQPPLILSNSAISVWIEPDSSTRELSKIEAQVSLRPIWLNLAFNAFPAKRRKSIS